MRSHSTFPIATLALTLLLTSTAFAQDTGTISIQVSPDGTIDVTRTGDGAVVPTTTQSCLEIAATNGDDLYLLLPRHHNGDTCIASSPITIFNPEVKQARTKCPAIVVTSMGSGTRYSVPRTDTGTGCAFPEGVSVVQDQRKPEKKTTTTHTGATKPRSGGNVTFDTPSLNLGNYTQFLDHCEGNETVWRDTFAKAEVIFTVNLELRGRIPSLRKQISPTTNSPLRRFRDEQASALVAVADRSSTTQSRQTQERAQLQLLQTNRNWETDSCTLLYGFARTTDESRKGLLTRASALAHAEWLIVADKSGIPKADERWSFLHNLSGEHLLEPIYR